MATLNDTIVAYLLINNIDYGGLDYQTGQPEGQADQVLIWNTTKLGAQPSADQLNSAYTAHQANLASVQQSKDAVKASALAKLTALGLTADEIEAIVGA